MLKISKLADYSMLIMHYLSVGDLNLYSAKQLADKSTLPLPTVSKLLKKLSDAGLVSASRGVQGGYSLIGAPDQLTVADVLNAIDGPTALTECSSLENHCSLTQHCHLRSNWQYLNDRVANLLSSITLADMQQPIKNTE